MRQKQALSVMMGGSNVFLTGAPGAGKTYVLNLFVERAMASGKRLAVTASTGIAASHLGGTTIHSWSGLGILDQLSEQDLERLGTNDRLLKRYNATDILVIDEISMLHGARLDMINRLAKKLRASDRPFGGLQIILVGDLFQLPPISRGSAVIDFAHHSDAWLELELQVCYLTEQHRQQRHDGLLELLEAMRTGEVEEHHANLLQERIGRTPDAHEVVTRLFAHNIDVDSINHRHLEALPGLSQTFQAYTTGSKVKLEQLAKSLLVADRLDLKIGAEVMFVANNFAEGFVNGSRGKVIDFDKGQPVVELIHGRKIHVNQHSWSLNEDGRIRAEVTQLPLRLAWAITIHKSQGMSLDAAEIDLRRAFTPGMGYVALSRVRSLAGLYLQGINTMAMTMHPHIGEFDEDLRYFSTRLAETTDDIPEAFVELKSAKNPIVDEVLFEKLKKWRLHRAKAEGVAPFMIAHNTTLSAVAAARPTNARHLLAVPGFGVRKVEQYGPDIVTIVLGHVPV